MNFALRRFAFTSLRARLMLILLSATLLLWGIAAVMSFIEAHHEIDELYDAQLATTARILLSLVGHEADEVELDQSVDFHKHEHKIAFQVWDEEGILVLRSANVPQEPFVVNDRDGFSDVQIKGQAWRVFSHWDEKHRFRVQVGERHDVREDLAETVVSSLFYPFLFALPLLALLVWLGVGTGLAPLRGITTAVSSREPQRA